MTEPTEQRPTGTPPGTEQKGVVTDVVVPLAQTVITTGGIIAAANIAKGKDDGKS
jgi:ABC-type phosphate transport system permease subunit